jgi:pyruvate formate lyase activating enzyme
VRVGIAGGVEPTTSQVFATHGLTHVEDHPLFHFYPGMKTFGIGTIGCNAACHFCQNWELALVHRTRATWRARAIFNTAEQIVEAALLHGVEAITFTYNEPTVWPEAIISVANAARAAGLRVILATNGFLSSQTLHMLLPYLDAVKIDLKGPDNESYRNLAGIHLEPVLSTMRELRAAGVWLEVSTVVVPVAGDRTIPIAAMAQHILTQTGAITPWHLMRFFPAYRMLALAPGDVEELRVLRSRAMSEGLKFVYIINVPDLPERNTSCPKCGSVVGQRSLGLPSTLGAQCGLCGENIPGRFS